MQINAGKIRRILAVRNDRFGEFLLNIPAFRALKETFPKAELTVVVDSPVRGLAGAVPFIDKIIEWPGREHNFFEIAYLSGKLMRGRFDLCVILNPSKEFNIAAYAAGIPLRAGYDRKWGFLLTHKIKDLKSLCQKHEVEYNLELVSLVQAKTDNTALALTIGEDIEKAVLKECGLDYPSEYIAIHPWTSDPIKKWSVNNFQELAKRIIKEFNIRLILIGGGENLPESQILFSGLGHNFINLTGKINLVHLAALLKMCKLLISLDSGPAHLAACVGTPVIALFRNDLPGKKAKRWGPWGSGHLVIEKNSLSDITVDEVFQKIKQIRNGSEVVRKVSSLDPLRGTL